ncbi:MAG: EVE domain-containing protein [Candidatus Altimarinota bacterium]
MAYWIMKSEPSEYSIDDLERDRVSSWFGVRNYQARNFMRDNMKEGDEVFFYHSSCDEVGIVGFAKVVGKPHPDETQFDSKSDYFDPKATREKPIWICIDVAFSLKYPRVITLGELRNMRGLEHMRILQKGNRLSITPLTDNEGEILKKACY